MQAFAINFLPPRNSQSSLHENRISFSIWPPLCIHNKLVGRWKKNRLKMAHSSTNSEIVQFRAIVGMLWPEAVPSYPAWAPYAIAPGKAQMKILLLCYRNGLSLRLSASALVAVRPT